MNKAKRNGSIHGPLMQKELPIYSSLKFIRPVRNTKKRHWTFRDYSFKPGIYVIMDLREKRATRVAKVSHCLYKAAIKYLEKRIEGNKNLRIAFLCSPKEASLRVWLKETAAALKRELLKIPIDKTYKKLRAHLKPEKKEKILSLLDFKPPFTGKFTEDGRRIRTFSEGYWKRTGTYVIMERENVKEDWIVVYCGLSYTQLMERMYHHFYSTSHESLIEYSSKLGTHSYKVALIEVSTLGKVISELENEVSYLEDFLIAILNPRDNDPTRKAGARERITGEKEPVAPDEFRYNPKGADFLD